MQLCPPERKRFPRCIIARPHRDPPDSRRPQAIHGSLPRSPPRGKRLSRDVTNARIVSRTTARIASCNEGWIRRRSCDCCAVGCECITWLSGLPSTILRLETDGMPVRSVLAENPYQKKFDVQLFVQRPKERLRRVSRGDQKMALVTRHKEPNFIHRKEV